MTQCRYKTLISNLPGMATVVNAFQSPQVQFAVYEELMQALNVRMEREGVPSSSALALKSALAKSSSPVSDEDLAHDLLEGDSIHSANPKG